MPIDVPRQDSLDSAEDVTPLRQKKRKLVKLGGMNPPSEVRPSEGLDKMVPGRNGNMEPIKALAWMACHVSKLSKLQIFKIMLWSEKIELDFCHRCCISLTMPTCKLKMRAWASMFLNVNWPN